MANGGGLPEAPKAARLDTTAFAAIALLAFGVRLVHLLQARAVPLFDAVIMDGRSYSEWADRIAGGDWLGDQVFYQAPLYPYFLAVVKLAVGDDLWRIRLVQIALGSLSCSILFLAGRTFFSRRAGIAAGVGLALYPPAIFFDGLIQKANIGLVWTVVLLWLLARARKAPSPARFALAGAALALLMLTREETILLVPVLLGWAWLGFRDHPRPERAGRVLGSAGGLALVLLPVGFRNLAVGGEFALTTSQAGPNFYIGNHAGATGTYVPIRPGRQNTAFERKDAVEVAERALGRSLTPGEVSAYWRGQAFAWIRSEPLAWLRLLGRKVLLLANAYEMPDYEDQYFYERSCGLLRALDAVWHFGVLVPLGLAGIVATLRRREAAILLALLATLATGIVLFYVFARYRYPVVPILLLFAGAAVDEAIRALRERRLGGLGLPIAVLAAGAVLANWPLYEKDAQLAASLNNAGTALAGKGDDEGAVPYFRESLRLQPEAPEILGNLGLSLMRLGRTDEAIDAFRRAAALSTDDWRPHLRLGAALEQKGRVEEGSASIARALRIDARGVLEAAELMMRQTNGRDLVALDILSAAQAANGSFAEAAATAERALEVGAAGGQAALLGRIRACLARYRAGETCR